MSAVPTTVAYQDSNSAYSLKGMSNYCANTAEYSGAEKGTHTLEFVAPADLDIVSFQFELFRDTSNASLGNYSSFTKQMAYNPAVSEDGLTVLRGSFSDINSYSVSKGDVLLTAEINMDINISEADSRDAIICFQVLDLQVRTPDGDVVLIRNGTIQEPTYKPEPETEPETRDGTRDPTENPTGYCTPETEFFIFGYSNYCKEIERFGGRLCGREHFTFKAPDNLNIIKMKFKLNYNIDYDHPYDPSAFSDKVEYTKKTDTDNPYLKDKYYTGGSFASNTPVSVNKGQTLLEFDVTAGPFEYFEMGEYVDDELCFEVTELIVEENGVKMYIVKDSKVLGEPVPFEPEVPTTETAAVIGFSPREEPEAAFLSEVCEKVTYFPMYKDETSLPESVQVIREKVTGIAQENGKRTVQTENGIYTADGVFVLREAVAPDQVVHPAVPDSPQRDPLFHAGALP